jgi:CheY-like chemotaxis protein
MFGKDKVPKILMVEDNENNHPLFIDAFEAGGFAVAIFQNAEGDFVGEVARVNPDIISMDIMIGKSGANLTRGGLEALQLIKSDERTKGIPVLMLTNFFEEGKVKQAKELGAVDYLSLQGFSISTLPSIFKTYLENPKKYHPIHPIFRE